MSQNKLLDIVKDLPYSKPMLQQLLTKFGYTPFKCTKVYVDYKPKYVLSLDSENYGISDMVTFGNLPDELLGLVFDKLMEYIKTEVNKIGYYVDSNPTLLKLLSDIYRAILRERVSKKGERVDIVDNPKCLFSGVMRDMATDAILLKWADDISGQDINFLLGNNTYLAKRFKGILKLPLLLVRNYEKKQVDSIVVNFERVEAK